VYRARDTKLQRDVAIKVLPEGSRPTAPRSRASRECRRFIPGGRIPAISLLSPISPASNVPRLWLPTEGR